MKNVLAEISVGAWNPRLSFSKDVKYGSQLANFVEKARSGFSVPEILFSNAGALSVAGRHFAVVTRDSGLIADSIHTLGRHEWHQLFFGMNRSSTHPKADKPPLIVANSGYRSYYHWTLESVGAVLVNRMVGGDVGALVVPPQVEKWQSDLMQLFSIKEPLIEVQEDELAAFDQAILTNLTGRSYSFSPHPVLLDEFGNQANIPISASSPRLIYVSRFDVPSRRRMENEAALCDLLRGYGFAIVSTGNLSVSEQAILFRNAELIVAPHGAGLTNLIYARNGTDGPKVIELLQEGYLSRGFLKLAQAKQLDYSAIINPDAVLAEYHHDGTWRCDLDLMNRTLAAL